jgi:glycerophosphoryl diester phosphodiesterase
MKIHPKIFLINTISTTLRNIKVASIIAAALVCSFKSAARELDEGRLLGQCQSFAFPKTQLHRGYWIAGLQENTLAAFEAAKDHNASMIELDVQFSKDRQVVVVHDYDLKRLLKKQEAPKVNELTADDLKKIAQIPTLQEVLTDSKIPSLVNVEIKQEQLEDQGLEQATIQVIQNASAMNRVIFSSFNVHSLERCAKLEEKIPRALLIARAKDDSADDFITRIKNQLKITQSNIIHLESHGLDKELSEKLKSDSICVNVWTVDNLDEAKSALKFGALSVITNNIDLDPILNK